MQIDLLIFDCDGVLINSEPIASRTLAKALQDAGAAITAEEVLVRFTGNSATAIRRICTEELGIGDLDPVFDAWHLDIYPEFARCLEPMPGMEKLVRDLRVHPAQQLVTHPTSSREPDSPPPGGPGSMVRPRAARIQTRS